jgi:hypothetical protein
MSERLQKLHKELLKAREWLKKNNIEDPTGRLAQKCAKEKIEFLEGRRKN